MERQSDCEICRLRPATTQDYALHGGHWVAASVCDECAKTRRRAILPYVGAVTAAAALFVQKAALATHSPPEAIAKTYQLTPMELPGRRNNQRVFCAPLARLPSGDRL